MHDIPPELTALIKEAFAKYPKGFKGAARHEIKRIVEKKWGATPPFGIIEEIAEMAALDSHELKVLLKKDGKQHREERFAHCTLSICTGLCCQLRGGQNIQKSIESWLGVFPGQATIDHTFYLRSSPCLHHCHKAPVIRSNEELVLDAQPSTVLYMLQKKAESRRDRQDEGRVHNPYSFIKDKGND